MEQMRKRSFYVVLVLLLLCILSGCSNKNSKKIIEEPDILQVRNICNLATLDCYYHNVAISKKEAEPGISHIGEKDRTFWIEYTGIVRLGINMSNVEMVISGENIEITLPEAEVLNITIDKTTLGEESYISSQDGWNNNKITADDQTEAINKAQNEMKETVDNNSSLLLLAQNRAKILIENYINQLGEAAEITYNIKWKYISAGQNTDTVQ